jgi:hypothetical protein
MSAPDIPPRRAPGSGRRRARALLAPAALVLGSGAANAAGLGWGLPHTVDWAVDSIAPHRVLEAAGRGFSGGWWDRYPPLQFALLAALYAPALAALRASGGWPAGEQAAELQPAAAYGWLILIARLVGVAMAAGAVLAVWRLARRLFGDGAAFFSGLMVAVNLPFAYYAHTANVDVPYLFWAALGLDRFSAAVERGALRDYVLFALFAALAACTKDQALALFVLAPLPLLHARMREAAGTGSALVPHRPSAVRRPSAARLLLDRRNVAAAAVAGVTFAVVQNLTFNAAGFAARVRYLTGPGSARFREHASTPGGHAALAADTAGQLAGAIGWPLLAVCAVGAALSALRSARRTLPLLLLAAGYALAFLHVIGYVEPRFVLPIAIVLSIPGGKLLADAWSVARHAGWRRRAIALAVRAAVVAAFVPPALAVARLDLLMLRDSRYAAERWLARNAAPGALVETLAPPPFVETRYPRFPSGVRVRSSRPAGGTAWLPWSSDPPRIPNAWSGPGDPDLIVLSGDWYEGLRRRGRGRGAALLRDLFEGRAGYAEAARFDPPAPRVPGLPVAWRVVIFRRVGAAEGGTLGRPLQGSPCCGKLLGSNEFGTATRVLVADGRQGSAAPTR